MSENREQAQAAWQSVIELARELAELQGRVERLELDVEHVAEKDRLSRDET